MADNEFLTTKELAARWKLSNKTLNNWRGKRTGPSFVKVGKSVLYRLDDVLAYEEENLQVSTCA